VLALKKRIEQLEKYCEECDEREEELKQKLLMLEAQAVAAAVPFELSSQAVPFDTMVSH